MTHHSHWLAAFALSTLLLACGGGEKKVADPDDSHKLETGDTPSDRRSSVPDMDEEGDENLEIEGLRGVLDPADIAAGIQSSSSRLSRCYEARVRRARFVGGSVELKFRVARDGAVARVQLSKSDLGSWPVEKCLLETSRGITFAKPSGGEAEFSVPLDFASGRGSHKWWDEERVEREVEAVIAELGKCAEEASAPDPRNVWITLYVGARGVVKSAGFSSPAETPIVDAWADCAASVVGEWKLSDPRGRMAKAGFRYNPE